MKNPVLQRIEKVRLEKKLSKNQFAFEIKIAQSTLASLYSRDNYPSVSIVNTIIDRFEDISLEWLLTGKGEMLKSNDTIDNTQSQTRSKNTIKYYPTVNGSTGGVEFLDNPDESSIDVVLPGFSECKFAINAYGDSMFPVIKNGQMVLLMEWNESFIDWGHIYMVITKSGYRAIKYLRPSEKEGFIKCESENRESNPPFEVDINDILKLFLVKGWVCRDVI